MYMRKRIFTTVIVMFYFLMTHPSTAQLKVNAGTDQGGCASKLNTLKLGGAPTAEGGTAPYEYHWKILNKGNLMASSYLSDTTSANPSVLSGNDTLIFRLSVKDAAGITGSDTVNILISTYKWILQEFRSNISSGDTLALNHGIGGGIKPFKYRWSPAYNISDTTSEFPKVWPDKDINYQLTILDSLECIATSTYKVSVKITGTDNRNERQKMLVYPVPVEDRTIISFTGARDEISEVQIFNSYGELVNSGTFTNDYEVGERLKVPGIYEYKIIGQGGLTGSGKLIRIH